MSKERLEEISKNTWIHVHLDKEATAELPKRHFEYLYEEAERVIELEEEYQGIIDKVTSERMDFLEQQNKRYRNLLESLSDTHDIASKIMKEQPDKKIIDANDLLQYILRKINDELESGTE